MGGRFFGYSVGISWLRASDGDWEYSLSLQLVALNVDADGQLPLMQGRGAIKLMIHSKCQVDVLGCRQSEVVHENSMACADT